MKGSLLTKNDVLRENHLYRKMCLDSTYSDLKTLRQVSVFRQASDLELKGK